MYCNGLLEFKTVARILVKSAAGYEYKCPVCGDSGARKTRPKLGARCRVKVVAADPERCDFAATALKGVIERNDATAYFGATGGVAHYISEAKRQGWVIEAAGGLASTEQGHAHYTASGLDKLGPLAAEGWAADGKPRRLSRAYLWDWSKYRRDVRQICLNLVKGPTGAGRKWAFTSLEAARKKAIALVGCAKPKRDPDGYAVARNGDCLFIIGATFEEIFQ